MNQSGITSKGGVSNAEVARRIMIARDYRVYLCRHLTDEDFDAIFGEVFRPNRGKRRRRWNRLKNDGPRTTADAYSHARK